MLLPVLLVVMQTAVPVADARPPARVGPVPPVVARAQNAANEFVRVWRFYWEASEKIRNNYAGMWDPPMGVSSLRLPFDRLATIQREYAASGIRGDQVFRRLLVHCHTDLTLSDVPATTAGVEHFRRMSEYIIEGSARHSICPSWFPIPDRPPWDENARGIDASLLDDAVENVRGRREKLLALLDSAAAVAPRDGWLVGQRVRFALDQRDTARARRTTRACASDRWWCGMLDAYLDAQGGATPLRTDSAFAAALGAMPADVRCAWSSVAELIDDAGRKEYRRLSCAARDSVNARFWWLSDPTFTEPGNDRRAQHYARRVLVALRTGTDWNERWDMRDAGGGQVVREMIIRYGWPSFSWWGGVREDLGHHDNLNHGDTERGHGRFATAEYAYPRFHPVPAWSAIVDPFGASGSEWIVSKVADAFINPADTLWWPFEHYQRPSGPLVQLWHQDGLFRRDTSILFVMSSNLPPSQFARATGDTLRGSLVFSTGPDSMVMVPRGGIVGYAGVFRAEIPSRPQVVSLELAGAHPAGVVARDRFGVRPPPTLQSMRPGEIAVSEPVLIVPVEPGEDLPSDPDAATARMYGTTVLRGQQRVGVYWETYGIAPGDTVSVSVRVEQHAVEVGLLKRIGFRFGIGEPPRSGVTIEWKEPQQTQVITSIAGRVPIQGRAVTLRISEVPPGDYTMTVSVARVGGNAVSASRAVWFR